MGEPTAQTINGGQPAADFSTPGLVGVAHRCVEILAEALAMGKGLLAVELDTERGEVTLDYDPTVLPRQQAGDLVADLSARINPSYRVCESRLYGNGCDACAEVLDAGDGEHDGTVAGMAVTQGRVTLQSSVVPIKRAQVSHGLHDIEPQASGRWLWASWDQTQWEVALTTITGVAIAIGWIGGALGMPVPWQTAFYGVAYVAGGYFGVRKGLAQLRHGQINVDLLMVLAAIGAALIGDWREGAILLFLFSLSNALQDYAMGRSRRAIEALMALRPEVALVKRDGVEVLVPVERLRPGEIVVVRPGERMPVDGVVYNGRSSVDQSSITGESMPVDVGPGSPVYASTVNQAGAVEVEVSRPASESTLARIIRLVEEAQEQKAPTQRFLDEFEQKYALVVIGATMLAIVVPVFLLNQPVGPSFYRAMTLLVVASPCALVISVPAAILSAIANSARHGILFKGGMHLENLAGVKAIAFDKTGTLTEGKPAVTDVVPFNGGSAEALLAEAASVEARSEHPLAQAIVMEARRQQLSFEVCDNLQAITGRGARAELPDGRACLIGNLELFKGWAIVPEAVAAQVMKLESTGKTAMLVGVETPDVADPVALHGIIAVADQPRADARDALEALRGQGIEHIIMLTGDNERVAQAIAAQVGVDEYRASLLPEDKVRAVQELRARYGSVAMVGDGVNDAPAMAASGLGIAMGAAGTDVALETADVVLMSDDLERIAQVIDLSRRSRRVIWQNIGFALGVIVVLVVSNFLVGVPLPLGVVAHEGSTLIVVANGLRLLR
jgi:Cd2+/Zn2+-exporting ATPase